MSASIAETLRQALLPGHTDHTRLIRLHTGQAAESLLAARFDGVECVGPTAAHAGTAGFRFQIETLSPNAALQAPDWLGKPVLIELLTQQSRTALRPFHGHVTAFERISADGGFGYYRLTLEPWLAFLSHRRDSFVFHDLTVPEIIEAVFADYAGQGTLVPQWRFDLADTSLYCKRSTCTQYQESDLAFIERLMAEEGLYYWFEHAAEGALDGASHTLVIADHPGAFQPNAQASIRYHRVAATEQSDTIQTLVTQHGLATHTIELASWDYRSLGLRQASATTPAHPQEPTLAQSLPLVRFDAPGAYLWPTREQGERYARRQTEALDAARQTLSGSGSVRTLRPGSHFTLTDHYDAGGERYAVLSVTHHARNNLHPSLADKLASLPTQSSQGGTASLYTNHFSVLPAALPYRPISTDGHGLQLHPRPTVRGTQTAIVVGEGGAGQPVHTDRDGRLRIQFHWQRGSQSHSRLTHPSGAEDASGDQGAWSWVRVMTPWAGANWGGHFIPRIGQEVLIGFIEGDIDRPVVLGALYNGQGAHSAQHNQISSGAGVATGNAPAWFAGTDTSSAAASPQPATAGGQGHAHAATLAGIKTQALSASQRGAGGYNQLVFDLTPQEPRTQLATTQYASALNLGAIRHQTDNQRLAYRGHGAELITQQSGALRAGSGLLLSTDARPQASGTQMDARLALTQLEAAHGLITSLADSAQKQQATLPGEPAPPQLSAAQALARSQAALNVTDTQNGPHGGSGSAPAWSVPLIVAESPAGISALTPQDAILNTGETLTLAAQDIQLTAQGKSAWAVKNGIVLYTYGKASDGRRAVQDKGLKLHAAQGKLSVQAQSDRADFNADKKLTITSTTADILLQGKNELQITAGGAAIQISGGNITLTAPGKVSLLASQRNLTSAKSATGEGSLASAGALGLEKYERLSLDEQFVLRDKETQAPLAGAPYRIEDDAGVIVAQGVTDSEGRTQRVRSTKSAGLKVFWGR